ncbi:MAG: DUF485 domain-containing protein [Planctomycetota bacterium]|nr:DUF485 domain-containing protein [Planctomycetota bacterium]
MLHEPANRDTAPDSAAGYKSRLGLILFFVYAAMYAGFVVINLTTPAMMEITVLWGINLAVVYGLALILAAFGLALAYDSLCRKREEGR